MQSIREFEIPNKIQPQEYSRGGDTDDTLRIGSVWWSSDGDRDVPYLYRNGSKRNLNLNWVENDWNERCRFAAVRNSLYFSLPVAAGFSLFNCRYQPPSILPTSLIFSETRINFLLSRAFISHATCRKNFSKSSFITAFCTYGSFWPLYRELAMKISSVVSINNESIFSPKVYREVLGKCGKNSRHNLYETVRF